MTNTHTGMRALTGVYLGAAISLTGTRMSFVAIPWLVLSTTGSSILTGLVAFAEMAPYVAVSALGGPVIDRVGARRTVMVTNVVSAVTFGMVTMLDQLRALPIAVLMGLVAVVGVMRAFGDNAMRVLLPDAVNTTSTPMARAVTIYDGISRAATLVGAPLSGVLVAAFGASWVVAVDALSFAVCAVIISTLVRIPSAEPVRREPYMRALRTGVRFIRNNRLLRAIGFMLLTVNLFDQAYLTVFAPVWANEVTGSPVILGVLLGSSATGAVVGNVIFTFVGPRMPRYATYATACLLVGAPRLFLMSLPATVWFLVAFCFVVGMAASVVNPILGTIQYEQIPRELQSRVLGMMASFAWAGIPLGSLMGGWVIEGLGLYQGLLLAAVLYLVITLWPLISPTWRQIGRPAK